MTDKQDAPSAAFALPGWQVLEATGADAAAFLQAQTMNDLRPLQPGHWQWNGWLTPKGRLIALFALAALDAQRYWLVSPDMAAVELAERLRRFVFRNKVQLRPREDALASAAFAPPARAQGSAFAHESRAGGEWIEFDLGADGGTRTLRIVAGAVASAGSGTRESTDDVWHWDTFDLAHGLPRLPPDQREAWTPQMLSLERLRAFSLKKGCYPGQEIVARTHFLGQAKRMLARITGDVPAVGAEVRVDGTKVGTICSRAGNEALAVVSVERPEGVPAVGEVSYRWERLLDGLAR